MYPLSVLRNYGAALTDEKERQAFEAAVEKMAEHTVGDIALVTSGTVHSVLHDTPLEYHIRRLGQDWMQYADMDEIQKIGDSLTGRGNS